MKRVRLSSTVAILSALITGTFLGAFLARSWLMSAEPGAAQAAQPSPPDSWLKGTTDEKLAQIERHLRGLDLSMAEIGYRYGELLIAAKTRNWDYAQYQTEKIDLSLRLAIERRPKRAASAQPFLDQDLPRVLQAVQGKDPELLTNALESLHNACTACHLAENVPHFQESVDRIREQSK